MAELPRGVRGHAYTVMITIFWRGEASTCVPSNTVDRTLQSNHKGKFHKKHKQPSEPVKTRQIHAADAESGKTCV